MLPEPERYEGARQRATGETIYAVYQQDAANGPMGDRSVLANATVARRAGVTVRTVKRHLAMWREWGWIERETRARVYREHGRWRQCERRGHPRGWQASSFTILCSPVPPCRTVRHLGKNVRKRLPTTQEESRNAEIPVASRCGEDSAAYESRPRGRYAPAAAADFAVIKRRPPPIGGSVPR